ncbi:MAG: VIT1/CCC1 transporter family protein [Synergistaceae bacterium]|jgi:VIT1/CCC1 family predicted Fe2+/Mn2+ transporter|uniref:VIT1/CCC1 transporter family protein n=1 Tax=Aminivibrio sp. TaxID=1872489 RepID=UPI001D5A59B9|nr:VIT1/CCC1 transporter family protein [Synergistaceae bacterium]NCC57246.1 rubrerythrin family protein [Synergistales bacterium]MDD3390175.1 VIT1/CCC1 transporter family protein [Synergistaceae bacterium]MDD3688715.1 VIT1/CCC1 transporter family protein [Synergistaceae bacterium]MDD4022010.1 VIT1/CCC1 transporter family protein [Synergistaceae bacterium]
MKNDYSEFLPLLREFQRTEITEWAIYTRLARRTVGPNGDILRRIGEDEKRHASIWERYTGKKIEPVLWKVWLFTLLASVLGITFAIKLMEKGEERAEKNYALVEGVIPEAGRILREETEHEEELTALIDEERLQYTSSMILGLNDALVELTGALAGFTFALGNGRVVALAGTITGIAAALSMSASEYLSQKSEEGNRKPLKAALYTGIAYLFTVVVLVAPYVIFTSPFAALGVMLLNGVAVILFFTFFMSVVRDIPFRKSFFEMLFISLGVAGVSFLIGFLARMFLDVDV